MAAPPDSESLESRINRATNPLNRETDWSSINAFCEQLNNDLEGPQLATRLLAHKIQSPQEWEAMQALVVLESCMKNCGKRFHNEVGKFRFLNELIKVVSPKYLGSRSPEPVKKKVLELIYSWTLGLPDEVKIVDAYQMLKKQGIIKQDPELPPDKLPHLPPPRPKNAIFEDEEKSKMLSRLLNSSHPEDLKAANKLIKEMVQEDQKRAEKVTKRVGAIQEVKESIALLTQLLQDYDANTTNQNNTELIQVMLALCSQDLYQRCEKMRPTLFRLASDTEDNDEALGTHTSNPPSQPEDSTAWDSFQSSDSIDADTPAAPTLLLSPEPSSHSHPVSPASAPKGSVLDELDLLGKTLLQQSLPPEGLQVKWDKQQVKPTLRDLQSKSGSNLTPNSIPVFSSDRPAFPLASEVTSVENPSAEVSLADVFVPLESIKPSSLLPVTVFDGHSLRVLLHFARDSPPSRPDVQVVIISMLSSAPLPVTNINLHISPMAVKLQPPSGTDLPAFNPILPTAAVTQIMLLANPDKEKVQLRYKLSFTLGEQVHNESGSLENWPAPDTWGNL
uniref:Golgi associated, gamma adaptin ear containing, ARF binding protein 1 n=1 Tax=Hippocampus comes TaxID=109280 RepID=A0A3Q2XJH1_HIPCM